ncbi:MAG TPA: dihydroorotate dehydrogenase electron transfer subunit [Phycisphaerae bacterium]|nr:dihydroorotate dehydrogenase electron transfer subunit [Phycisphaerae bacterium]
MTAPALDPSKNDRVKPLPGSPRGSFAATVRENRHLCTDHYRLILSLERFPASSPGQFVQLDCRDPAVTETQAQPDTTPHEFEWGPGAKRPALSDADFLGPIAYLRRPFSIADHRVLSDGSAEIDIIHRVVGRGTHLLARLQPGQRLSLLGPLGIGFAVPPTLQTACLVGGGVGIPPMLYFAKTLAASSAASIAFLGAQRKDLLAVTLDASAPPPSPAGEPVMNVAELLPHRAAAVITTDDGSLGMKGYVTQALRLFLEKQRAAGADLQRIIVYCCGPTPMMKATAKVAAEFDVACQVSLEQPMACGMGTCQSCIIKHRPHVAPVGTDWSYKLTCTHGPVFDTRDIVW